jgi:predicted KAP-like P-loop ATPase
MSIKAVKKIRKLKDELDKLHEKEDDLLFKIDEVIDELEDPNED